MSSSETLSGLNPQVAKTPAVRAAKMELIEAARALAALVVVLMHAANLMNVQHFSGHVGMNRVFDFGYVGVDFFFVLSGFIITYVHFADIGNAAAIPKYLWRRVARIYPIYWFMLALSVLAVSAGRLVLGKGMGLDMGTGDILSTVFLVIGQGEPKYVGVAWSLQYEILFYLAFCILLAHARLGVALFSVWALWVAGSALGWIELTLPLSLGNAHCLQFLMGVAVGAAARRFSIPAPARWFWIALAALVAAIWFEVYGPLERHSAAGRFALGVASALVLLALVGLEQRGVMSPPRWLTKLGSVSYSIYLGHILIISLTYSLLLKLGIYHALPEVLVYLIGVGAAIFATVVIGVLVELPLVKKSKDGWNALLRMGRPKAQAVH